jgi:hypothetical protein
MDLYDKLNWLSDEMEEVARMVAAENQWASAGLMLAASAEIFNENQGRAKKLIDMAESSAMSSKQKEIISGAMDNMLNMLNMRNMNQEENHQSLTI